MIFAKKYPPFLGRSAPKTEYKSAKFVVIPVPHEKTTSYGKGTKNGPREILRASAQLELFDLDSSSETVRIAPIFTERAVTPKKLADLVSRVLKDKKIPVILGGEHSLSPWGIQRMAAIHKKLSVLQIDAHADLRDSYQGRKDSHACAVRRILESTPVVQVGIRSLAKEEYDWAKKHGQLKKIHFAGQPLNIAKILNQLGRDVYLTIDVDGFDPAVIPATGTPEPGGLLWAETLALLKEVCRKKNLVGFDVVELSPRPGDILSPYTAAKLVYKIMGFIATK